jgi:hypothetical protein
MMTYLFPVQEDSGQAFRETLVFGLGDGLHVDEALVPPVPAHDRARVDQVIVECVREGEEVLHGRASTGGLDSIELGSVARDGCLRLRRKRIGRRRGGPEPEGKEQEQRKLTTHRPSGGTP